MQSVSFIYDSKADAKRSFRCRFLFVGFVIFGVLAIASRSLGNHPALMGALLLTVIGMIWVWVVSKAEVLTVDSHGIWSDKIRIQFRQLKNWYCFEMNLVESENPEGPKDSICVFFFFSEDSKAVMTLDGFAVQGTERLIDLLNSFPHIKENREGAMHILAGIKQGLKEQGVGLAAFISAFTQRSLPAKRDAA